LTIHHRAEGTIEYTGLLYVPETKPFDLFHPDRKHRVKLYLKRVFITDDCKDLLPAYLRFLRGVVDTPDLPLNISREMLQKNPLLTKIRNGLSKKVLSELKKVAESEPERYLKFWNNFGAVLKEGLYEDGTDNRDTLLSLLRFDTTAGHEPVSLADYVGRMKPGQEAIYYINGDDLESLRNSPQIEGFAAKGIEVLLTADAVDDFWMPMVANFQGKPFQSVTRGGIDLSKIAEAAPEGEKKDETKAESGQADVGPLVAMFKLALGDAVKDVRSSDRLTDSPVCLVADSSDLDMRLERLLRQHKQLNQTAKRILEINPRHALILSLARLTKEDGVSATIEDAARLLLDQARILEGEPVPDPKAFARRMAAAMQRGFGSRVAA
jgi:molecular chaperone HtpG